MHRPPAVAWDLSPARWQGWALATLALFAALVWSAFLATQGWGAPSVILLLAMLAGALLAAMARHNAARGQLRWDGERWHWSGEPDRTVRAMACVLDLQSMMLLHLTCESRTSHWLWLEAGNKPERWKALRRAVVASTADTHDEGDPELRDA